MRNPFDYLDLDVQDILVIVLAGFSQGLGIGFILWVLFK